MRPEHVMLDLETLGTSLGSVILSIGAYRFSPFVMNDPGAESLHLRLNVAQQLCLGSTVTKGTIDWWSKQSPEAQKIMVLPETELRTALDAFVSFCDGASRVWGNGPSFDCLLLYDLFNRAKVEWPFSYYNERDFRTIKDLVPNLAIERSGVFHNALDDAITQARHVQKVYAQLGIVHGAQL